MVDSAKKFCGFEPRSICWNTSRPRTACRRHSTGQSSCPNTSITWRREEGLSVQNRSRIPDLRQKQIQLQFLSLWQCLSAERFTFKGSQSSALEFLIHFRKHSFHFELCAAQIASFQLLAAASVFLRSGIWVWIPDVRSQIEGDVSDFVLLLSLGWIKRTIRFSQVLPCLVHGGAQLLRCGDLLHDVFILQVHVLASG